MVARLMAPVYLAQLLVSVAAPSLSSTSFHNCFAPVSHC